MKPVLKVYTIAFALLSPMVLFAQQPTLSCRPLPDSNTFIQPDEHIVGNQICKIVATPAAPQLSQVAKLANDPATAPPEAVATTSPAVAPAPRSTPVVVEAPAKPINPCLIVASAEGHRFRDSMIAGVLTGGIGFVGGALVGGAKYDYRDSFDMPASEVKVKYKGKELQKIEQTGVHIEIVSAKDKTGSEVDAARKSCRER